MKTCATCGQPKDVEEFQKSGKVLADCFGCRMNNLHAVRQLEVWKADKMWPGGLEEGHFEPYLAEKK
jgi:hypothetical protein